MAGNQDTDGLLDNIPFDPEMLKNLAAADPDAMREMLSTYLREDEVDAILERVKNLTDAD